MQLDILCPDSLTNYFSCFPDLLCRLVVESLSCCNQHRFKTKWDDTPTNTTANIATAVVATDVPFENPYFN